MAQKYDNVIVFGASGQTGSAAALEASRRGAKVWLAVRDPSKPIPKLDNAQGNFEKIQADLTDNDSVTKAIQKSGAKAAYIYCVLDFDKQKSLTEALKAAGVEYIVLLSSFTIKEDDPKTVAKEDMTGYHHSQVEMAIDEVGIDYTSLRPGFFATNFIQELGKDTGDAKIFRPDARFDFISPEDIGRVGGAVLVDRPSAGRKEIIYLNGPEILSKEKALQIVNENSGRQYKLIPITADELKASSPLPPPVIEYFIDRIPNTYPEYYERIYPASIENIEKYSGKPATTFAQYVKENSEKFV